MGLDDKITRGTTSGFPAAGTWRKALLAGVAIAFAVGVADPADAARKAKTTISKSKRDVAIKHPFGEDMPRGPLQLVISVADQKLTLYSNGKRIAQAPVSTGTSSHPTPTGIFSVIQKNRWHRSNLYGNAPMFYMHRLTWSGIALHEGHLPGRPASHGCIRLPTEFVSRLWNVSRLGARVVVARVDVAPSEISHAKLFNPKPKPVENIAKVSQSLDGLRSTLTTVGGGEFRSETHLITVAEAPSAAVTDAPSTAASAVAGGRVPINAVSTGRAAVASPDAVPVTQSPAIDAAATTAPATFDAITNSILTMPAPAAAPELAAEPLSVLARPAAIDAAPANAAKPEIDPDELLLPRPSPLRTRAAEPAKLNGQVAVMVSRKEKRIFVRHAFVPLFDMPVEIANPDHPIGHHVYTALEVKDEGTSMRWNVITMPRQGPPAAANAKNAKSKAQAQPKTAKQKRTPPYDPRTPSNASEALDRITIPQEALDRIAELLVPGSSLIISDEGLGRETGRYTEFIVETR